MRTEELVRDVLRRTGPQRQDGAHISHSNVCSVWAPAVLESPAIPALCVFAPRLPFRPPCEGRLRFVFCVVLHSFFSCRAHLVRAGLGFGRHTGRFGAPLLLEGSSPARSRLRCPSEPPEVLRSTASQCVAGFSYKRSPRLEWSGRLSVEFTTLGIRKQLLPD